MNAEDKKLANLAFSMSAFLAFGMLWFEVEKTEAINLFAGKGVGHFLVLAGLGASGLVLFYLAGQLRTKNAQHANIVFFFSVCLRIFVGYYIETLEGENVFASGERWTIHIGNLSLAFIEIAFAFTQSKGNAMQALEDKHLEKLGQLANEKKEALAAKEKSIRDELSENILSLSEQLEEKQLQLDSISTELNSTKEALSASQIAANKWERFEPFINKPQRKGTRYALITSEGAIVKCNKKGKHLEEIEENKQLINA